MKNEDIKKYYFSLTVATELGIEEAIMFCNIYFWVNNNKRNNSESHHYEGKYWTYNSVEDFIEQYPFWTHSMIKRILKKLENAGYIETGNFNKHKYDRTKWYTVSQKGFNSIENNKGSTEIDEWLG